MGRDSLEVEMHGYALRVNRENFMHEQPGRAA
jgi:hypothetical protein